ncbi:MAG: DUF3095 domain-containing protein [Planctomycetes bacterium]|nr:DUF3095 domain-containing protein [Planctomycetota bacterium]
MTPEESELFYQNLKEFSNFDGINDVHNFRRVPDDWFVVITDVKGSTKAIEAGKYKDVNTVGAAAIACVQNAMGELEYPFVFGGDGATLLIPPTYIEKIKVALSGLKALSEKQFELGLRVGVVPVKQVLDSGVNILVAKYHLVGKKSVAIFRGGGLTAAEGFVKGSDTYEIPTGAEDDASLKGLSCRWQPIPSKSGKVLSILVVARSADHDATYRNVLKELNDVFEGNIEVGNPVNLDVMNYKSVGQCLRDEKRYHGRKFTAGYIWRVIEIFLAVMIFKFKIPLAPFNPKKYANSMRTHSDYRKFDDALRMVLDCTEAQVELMREKLDALHERGEIFYGTHESDNCLMTCYVHDVSEGNHIHFIDGGSGGYAMAAKQLKGQMKG